jgi:hypothetical protein
MLALKMMLTVAGALLLAAALGIPLYGIWIGIRKEARVSQALKCSAN